MAAALSTQPTALPALALFCRQCDGYGWLTRSGYPAPDGPFTDDDHVTRFACDEPGCTGRVRECVDGQRIPTPTEAERERIAGGDAADRAEYAADARADR